MANYKNAKDFLNNSYSTSDVKKGVYYWSKFLLSRCQNMFVYKNLPDTLPSWEIEKNLLMKGNGCVVKKEGKLYIPFSGSVYGYDAYLVPNRFTFGNPVIGSASGLQDNKNCAIIWNSDIDKLGGSWFWETVQRYSRLLADLESTFTNAMVYSRAGLLGQASNQTAATGVDKVITNLRAGDVTTIMNAQMNFDSIQLFGIQPIISFNGYTEARDYLVNCFLNSIGLQTLEEKKERMVLDEISADSDTLNNNIDIMYKARCEGIDKVNKVFGTEIEVFKNQIMESEITDEQMPDKEEIIENEEVE